MTRVLASVCLLAMLLMGGGYTEAELEDAKHEAYEDGYNSGYDSGFADGYDSGIEDGNIDEYEWGYEEGFQYAVNFILDRMDSEYREKWWRENIDEITDIGLEY